MAGRGAGGTCYEVGLTANDGSCAEEVVGTANEQFGFLLKGHGLDYLIDVVSTELRLGICCHNE